MERNRRAVKLKIKCEVCIKDGDVGSNATSSHPTQIGPRDGVD